MYKKWYHKLKEKKPTSPFHGSEMLIKGAGALGRSKNMMAGTQAKAAAKELDTGGDDTIKPPIVNQNEGDGTLDVQLKELQDELNGDPAPSEERKEELLKQIAEVEAQIAAAADTEETE